MHRKDFKPRPQRRSSRLGKRHLAAASGAGILGLTLAGFVTPSDARVDAAAYDINEVSDHNETAPSGTRIHLPLALPKSSSNALGALPSAEITSNTVRQVIIKRGDTLSAIFKRLNLVTDLNALMASAAATHALTLIKPGEKLEFITHAGQLQRLTYQPLNAPVADFIRNGSSFRLDATQKRHEKHVFYADGRIRSSLFIDGHKAGLSDRLIMQLAEIFGWDIDFALDLRVGDHFTVVYDSLYDRGAQVREGNILVAEFTNQGRKFIAVRYTSPDGRTGYYTTDGHSLRKAFLRTPVQFSRISSRFSLHRKHPILNRIRAHKGVDYAAPTGTPVRAAGDGKVAFKGWKGGYGRFIVLQHGQRYSTAYGHLSRFASSLKAGARVKQGQIIGYVGQSGLATGPHLHYEFRIGGVHRDPLTVKLPAAAPLDAKYMTDFRTKLAPLLAQIDSYHGAQLSRLE